MHPRRQRGRVAFLACLLWLVAAGPAGADQALLVGVGSYPNLPAANQLEGSVGDARSLASALQRYGFSVTLLTDAQATRSAIMAALERMGTSCGTGERFVFYFAGHGTPNGCILPHDACLDRSERDITRDELAQAIKRVPARARTVLLDACHSAQMIAQLREKAGAKARVRVRSFDRALPGAVYSGTAVPAAGAAGGADRPCYFVAARPHETAKELEIDGRSAGVFTHFLVSQLDGTPRKWGDIQRTVSQSVTGCLVVQGLPDDQHPTLSGGFEDGVVFEPAAGAHPGTARLSAWELYHSDRVDASVLDMAMIPSKPYLRLGEQLSFRIQPGRAGYLVVLNRDPDNNVEVLYPKSRRVEDAAVGVGQVVSIPNADRAYIATVVGTERIRAILFTSATAAQAFLQQFAGAVPLAGGASRAGSPIDVGDYHTVDVTFEAVP